MDIAPVAEDYYIDTKKKASIRGLKTISLQSHKLEAQEGEDDLFLADSFAQPVFRVQK